MTTRKLLTDARVRALKPAPARERYDTYDTLIPNLLVRTTSTGHKTFCLRAVFPGKGRVRREIGEFGRLSCDDARAKARRWLSALAEGVDPGLAERREEGRAVTFADAVDQWLTLRVRGKRKARDVEREVRAYLLPKWGSLPVGSITRLDVKQLIAGIRDGGLKGKPAPYQAHNVLGHVRSFYRWAVHEERFGLDANPAREIEPSVLIGKKESRERVLTDDELRAFWRATGNMTSAPGGYPYGPLLRLLLLTGARNTEARDARWCEFDDDLTLWTIPAERFKTGSVHLVPLSGAAQELLRELPKFQWGDHLFTSTFGRTPVYGLSKAKAKLDELMRAELGGKLTPFVVHDLRRTVRSRLASLDVPERVAELVIGHARTGIVGVYDRHSYEPQMRVALEKWAQRLMAIVEHSPRPDNVVPLREVAK